VDHFATVPIHAGSHLIIRHLRGTSKQTEKDHLASFFSHHGNVSSFQCAPLTRNP
jgi:hypothetical protein